MISIKVIFIWAINILCNEQSIASIHQSVPQSQSDTVKLRYGYAIYSLNDSDSCFSVKNGTVVRVLFYSKDEGMVEVKMGQKRIVYGNLRKIYVKKGQKVANGDFIGQLNIDDFKKQYFHSEIYLSDSKGRIEFYL